MKRKELERLKQSGVPVTLYEGAKLHDAFYPS